MDVRTWTTLSRLLDEALDLAPVDRTTWLEGLAAEYEAFKPQLRAMLDRASSIDDSSFLATLPKFELAEDDERNERLEPGAQVGPYRLVRQLAAGGQAAVWLGERLDGLFQRAVAIKLPHDVTYRPGLAERMAREREILARLTHPNIARLYDAGVTADGTPFLALEYIEGTPIDRYCADRALDGRACVRLFLQVLGAVAYAHGQLVIHRDLKPSNVLVTEDGQVRLVDFGIARMLDDGADGDSALTAVGGRAMTLAYASPEQVSRAPLGVATDIYSLGVMLYELLAGAGPYGLTRDSPAALEQAILSTEPGRPSAAAATQERRTALRGDLDAIVLQMLEKAPADRYATAAALAEDLDRFLDGRPVDAQPDGWWYRVRKLVARHRFAVGATAAVLVAILIGSGVAVWQMLEADAQRDAAVRSQRRAEAFSDFMRVLLQDAGAGGRPLAATELLDRGTEVLDRQDADDAVAAYMRYEISRHYLLLNQTDRELTLLERSAGSARRIGDTNLLAAAECAAAASLVPRDRAGAEARLAAGERALAAMAAPSSYTRADCLRARARLRQARGDVPGAIAALEGGLGILDDDSLLHPSRRELLMTQLADLYRASDRFEDALALSERSLAAVRNSGRSGSLAELSALNNHAGNLFRVGEVVAAAGLQEQALAWVEAVDPAVQPVGIRLNLGFTRLRLGDAQRALALAEADRPLAERAGNGTGVALSHLLAARSLLAMGHRRDSWVQLRLAEAIWHADRPLYGRMLTEAALHRSDLHAAEGDLAEAQRLTETTLAELGYPDRRTAPGLDRVLRQAATVALLAGDPEASARFAAAALDISRRLAREARHSADVGEAALLRARAFIAHGRHEPALADATLAAEALAYGLGKHHAQSVEASTLVTRVEAR